MSCSYTYDRDRLSLISVEDNGIICGSVFSRTVETYPYIMLWNSDSDTNFNTIGTLVTLKFKVLENAPIGIANISLDYKQENVYDVNLDDVSLSIKKEVLSYYLHQTNQILYLMA